MIAQKDIFEGRLIFFRLEYWRTQFYLSTNTSSCVCNRRRR